MIRDLGYKLPSPIPENWKAVYPLLQSPDLIWVAEYNAACIQALKKLIGPGDSIRKQINDGEAKFSEDGKSFCISIEESTDLKLFFHFYPEVQSVQLTKCLVDPQDLSTATNLLQATFVDCRFVNTPFMIPGLQLIEFTGSWPERFQNLPKDIQSLKLHGRNIIRSADIDFILKHCGSLKCFDLSECPEAEITCAITLMIHRQLQYLNFSNCNITSLPIIGCFNMKEIYLARTDIDNDQLKTVCRWSDSLEVLDLESCPKIDLCDNSVVLPSSLKKLNLSFCLVSEKAIQDISQNCHDLQQIELKGCVVTRAMLQALITAYNQQLRIQVSIGDDVFNGLCLLQDCAQEIIKSLSPIPAKLIEKMHQGSNQLDFTDINLRDADLHNIICFHANAVNVETLDISDMMNLTDTALQYIHQACCNLKNINLKSCNITDTGLKYLSQGCPNIQVIELAGLKLTDTALQFLAQGCPKIENINLITCSQITDEGLKFLAKGCPNIQTINLFWCEQITDEGLNFLSKGCHNIDIINIGDCKNITDDGVKFLTEQCQHIKSISLGGTQVTDKALMYLSKWCQNIQNISLNRNITDVGLKYLAEGCHGLQKIFVQKCKISDEALKYLASNCPNIRRISLMHCNQITDEGLNFLSKGCHNIQNINLNECKISDLGIKFLAEGCQKIQKIDLTTCKITDTGLKYLAANCPDIKTLNLTLCKHITDAGLQVFSENVKYCGYRSGSNVD